ncbi:FAD binding domain-containing protein [Cupriavidus sp. 30B13]|uniref:FAD binding domain-containing protein n=1 Tax=Cupriavidus sp. 30B13 TaxID=3384241 RepID=UPI003B8FABF9
MELVTPATPQDAQALADRLGARARFIAGGTLLQQEWDEPRLAPPGLCFINVQAWPETQRIALGEAHLRIGAGARLETVRTHALVLAHAPLLSEALGQLGALGVRRLGTLGGNVGWGMGDSAPVLLALDAEAELADGTREPLERTLLRPVRPLMVAFHLPRADARRPVHAVFEKVGYRAAFSPGRLRLALRWRDAARGRAVVRAAAGAPGVSAVRLHAVEALLAEPGPRPGLAAVRGACLRALPPPLALIASRLIAGHCGLL